MARDSSTASQHRAAASGQTVDSSAHREQARSHRISGVSSGVPQAHSTEAASTMAIRFMRGA